MRPTDPNPTPDLSRLSIELVPRTAWWSNVRSNVTSTEWKKCKDYSKTKTDGCCIICGGVGKRYPTEAHEIWHYDDDNQIQTLVDIVPLCPMCHAAKHLGRSREVSNLVQWTNLLVHIQRVNNWAPEKLEKYIKLQFEIWNIRSTMTWELDISFLETLGITKTLERNGRPC